MSGQFNPEAAIDEMLAELSPEEAAILFAILSGGMPSPRRRQSPAIDVNNIMQRFDRRDFSMEPGVMAVIVLVLRVGEPLPELDGAALDEETIDALQQVIVDYDAGIRDCNCGNPSCERHAAFLALAALEARGGK